MFRWVKRIDLTDVVAVLAAAGVAVPFIIEAAKADEQVAVGIAAAAQDFSTIGRAPTPEEIKTWDIDIRPDGLGLPPGEGTVAQGEEVYAMQCAHCHGDFGFGVSGYPPLVGGTAEDLHIQSVRSGPEKTIGSYWPYASTVFDYIRRAMPFGNAQSLTDDEVYALTAYLLNINGVIDDDVVMNAETLPKVKMPNEDGFVMDDRPDVVGTTCMKDCVDEVKITSRAKVLGVTPEGEDALR